MKHHRVKPGHRVDLDDRDAGDIVHALEDMAPRPPKLPEIDWTKLRRDVSES